MPKTHLRKDSATKTACGRRTHVKNVVEDPREVTCENCKETRRYHTEVRSVYYNRCKIFLKDHLGQWYLLPEKMETRFRKLQTSSPEDLEWAETAVDITDKFREVFSEYRVDSPEGYYVYDAEDVDTNFQNS